MELETIAILVLLSLYLPFAYCLLGILRNHRRFDLPNADPISQGSPVVEYRWIQLYDLSIEMVVHAEHIRRCRVEGVYTPCRCSANCGRVPVHGDLPRQNRQPRGMWAGKCVCPWITQTIPLQQSFNTPATGKCNYLSQIISVAGTLSYSISTFLFLPYSK